MGSFSVDAHAGLGTDTGNSIRGPSAHQALFGIRSTMGLTSRAGVVPLNNRADIAGPMARSAADCGDCLNRRKVSRSSARPSAKGRSAASATRRSASTGAMKRYPRPRDRFHETGVVGVVAEHGPQTLDGRVEAVLEIDVGARRPQPLAQLVTGHHAATVGQQHPQHLEGLVLEAHGYKVRVTELTGLEHSLKNELIVAERHQRSNAQARGELERLIGQLGVRPALLDVMN